MKKAVLALCLIVIAAAGVYSQERSNRNLNEQPALERENTVVFDAWKYGRRYEDYIKMFSSMRQQEIYFNILGYNPQVEEWEILGTARLKRMGDIDTVSPLGVGQWGGILGRYRWFALQSIEGLNFGISVSVSNNDIRITVFDK